MRSNDSLPDELIIAISELLFLDHSPEEYSYSHVKNLIQKSKIPTKKIEEFTIQYIAPVCAPNLGYLIYPVIGAWDGFDKEDLLEKIQKEIQKREKRLSIINKMRDRFFRRMIYKLEFGKLI